MLLEFASLEEQLSGVERYAMKFIETENADIAEQQLRQAEVNLTLYYVYMIYVCVFLMLIILFDNMYS